MHATRSGSATPRLTRTARSRKSRAARPVILRARATVCLQGAREPRAPQARRVCVSLELEPGKGLLVVYVVFHGSCFYKFDSPRIDISYARAFVRTFFSAAGGGETVLYEAVIFHSEVHAKEAENAGCSSQTSTRCLEVSMGHTKLASGAQ